MRRIQRVTAIHEAGHAIAECRYSDGFYQVHAGPDDGFCMGVDRFWPLPEKKRELLHLDVRRRAFRHIVGCFAGSDAQAIQSKKTTRFYALLSMENADAEERRREFFRRSVAFGCIVDLENAFRAAELVTNGEKDFADFLTAAGTESHRFVRDPAMWGAINALADLLQDRGTIKADEADAIAITKRIKRLDDLEIQASCLAVKFSGSDVFLKVWKEIFKYVRFSAFLGSLRRLRIVILVCVRLRS